MRCKTIQIDTLIDDISWHIAFNVAIILIFIYFAIYFTFVVILLLFEWIRYFWNDAPTKCDKGKHNEELDIINEESWNTY